MKKLLALVLALVMTLGLATVGANAALSDFSDGSETAADYEEALGVMNMVGVFAGSDGKITPKAALTRAQAAKLIAYLDLGETAAETLPAKEIFPDVPATHWAAKYVAYCAEQGIIQGSDGKFLPDDGLTGYAFGAYLLAVLGYDRNIEGMTGANWEIATAKVMSKAGVGAGVDKAGSATLTREEGAQFCFEALKANCVEYANKGTTVSGENFTVSTGASQAAAYDATYGGTWDNTSADTTNGKLQLGEKLYKGKLNIVDTRDVMNRVAEQWTFTPSSGAVRTITAASDADVVIENTRISSTAALDTLLKDAGYTLAADGSFSTYLNGNDTVTGINAKATLQGMTGAGIKIEFYDENDDNVLDHVFVTTQLIHKLAKGDIHAAKSNGDPRYISLPGAATNSNFITDDFAAGDYIVYTYSYSADVKTEGTVGQRIVSAQLAKSFDGKATAIGKDGNVAGVSVTVDGTTYPVNLASAYTLVTDTSVGQAMTGKLSSTWTFYQDTYGNIILAKEIDTAAATDYFYVNSYQVISDTDNLTESGKTAYANVVFTDGTVKVVRLSVDSDNKVYLPDPNDNTREQITINASINRVNVNHWYAYTENSDGTYTVKNIDPDYAFVKTGATVSTTKDTMYNIAADTGTTYYTTKDTQLVKLGTSNGKISTSTGFVTWTNGNAAEILVTYPKSSSAVNISAIYAPGQTITGSKAINYAYVIKKDAELSGNKASWVLAVDGKQDSYKISTAGTLGAGLIYSLSNDASNEGFYTAAQVTHYDACVYYISGDNAILCLSGDTRTTYKLASDVKFFDADRAGAYMLEEEQVGVEIDEEDVGVKMDVRFVVNDDSKIAAMWVIDDKDDA